MNHDIKHPEGEADLTNHGHTDDNVDYLAETVSVTE
jgi:hypothetical protein